MKVRLQDIVKLCDSFDDCRYCVYYNGECMVNIDGFIPSRMINYVDLCGNSPELAKALYTNVEIEL